MGFSLRPAKWNFFSLASSKRISRTAKEQFKELILRVILICWDIYIAKSLQPKKVIVLDNNDCCKGWTLNGTLQKDFSSAIFAEPKPFCKVPLRVHPLPHSFLSTKRTIQGTNFSAAKISISISRLDNPVAINNLKNCTTDTLFVFRQFFFVEFFFVPTIVPGRWMDARMLSLS